MSRSVNQWGYTLAGLKNKRFAYYYGSGDMPQGAVARLSAYKLTTTPTHVYELGVEDGDFVQSSADEAVMRYDPVVKEDGQKMNLLRDYV